MNDDTDSPTLFHHQNRGRGTVSISNTSGAGVQVDVSTQEAAAGPLSVGRTEGRGRHVAYVDDYEAMTFLVSEVLKDLGYRVSCFEHADDGLAAVRIHPADFDIVVTDLNMPGHSGLDLARELHALRPDLPVIIATGFITDALLHDAQACGVRLVFDKQNLVAELPGHIARVLDALPPEQTRTAALPEAS